MASLFFQHSMDHCLLTLGHWVGGKGCRSGCQCPQNKVSDVEYQGQGRHDVFGAPPSEWVGGPRVSTHREEEMGERKQL